VAGLPARSLTLRSASCCHCSGWTLLLQLPLLCTMALPIAVVPSRMVTVGASYRRRPNRAGNGLRRLVGRCRPRMVIATISAVIGVQALKLWRVPVVAKLSVWLATMGV